MAETEKYWDPNKNGTGEGGNRKRTGNQHGPKFGLMDEEGRMPGDEGYTGQLVHISGSSTTNYTPLSGQKDIAAANTPVALSATSQIVKKLNIKAKRDNIGYVAVGDNTINANEGSEQGYPLEAEEPMPTMENVDLAEVYVTGPTVDDGVTYTALVESS
jgi:hypothetical protein